MGGIGINRLVEREGRVVAVKRLVRGRDGEVRDEGVVEPRDEFLQVP